jgi:hypothetical protein
MLIDDDEGVYEFRIERNFGMEVEGFLKAKR